MDPNLLTRLRGPPGPDLDEACARLLMADIKGETVSAAWPALAQLSAMEGEVYLKCIIYRLLTRASRLSRITETSSFDMMCRNSVTRDLRSQVNCQTKVLAAYHALSHEEIDTSALHTDSTIFIRLLCVDSGQYASAWTDGDPLVRARGVLRILRTNGEEIASLASEPEQTLKLKHNILSTKVSNLDFRCALELITLLSQSKLRPEEFFNWQSAQLISATRSIRDDIALAAVLGILNLQIHHAKNELLSVLLSIFGRYEDSEPPSILAENLIEKIVLTPNGTEDFDEIDTQLTCQVLYGRQKLRVLWKWWGLKKDRTILNYFHMTVQEILLTRSKVETEEIKFMTDALKDVSPDARKIWLSIIVGKHCSQSFHEIIRSILELLVSDSEGVAREDLLASCINLFARAPHAYRSILTDFIPIAPCRLETLKENPKTCKDAIERLAFLQKHMTVGEIAEMIQAHWSCCRTLRENLGKIDINLLKPKIIPPSTTSTHSDTHGLDQQLLDISATESTPDVMQPSNQALCSFLEKLIISTGQVSPAVGSDLRAETVPNHVSAKRQLENALDDFFREL